MQSCRFSIPLLHFVFVLLLLRRNVAGVGASMNDLHKGCPSLAPGTWYLVPAKWKEIQLLQRESPCLRHPRFKPPFLPLQIPLTCGWMPRYSSCKMCMGRKVAYLETCMKRMYLPLPEIEGVLTAESTNERILTEAWSPCPQCARK
jgi:hypothetical protein